MSLMSCRPGVFIVNFNRLYTLFSIGDFEQVNVGWVNVCKKHVDGLFLVEVQTFELLHPERFDSQSVFPQKYVAKVAEKIPTPTKFMQFFQTKNSMAFLIILFVSNRRFLKSG